MSPPPARQRYFVANILALGHFSGERTQIYDAQGHYHAEAHIAEMIRLLGLPPAQLIEKSRLVLGYKWPESIKERMEKFVQMQSSILVAHYFDENSIFTIIYRSKTPWQY